MDQIDVVEKWHHCTKLLRDEKAQERKLENRMQIKVIDTVSF